MSSGKIGMVLTYTRKKQPVQASAALQEPVAQQVQAPAALQAPAPAALQAPAPPTYVRMNRRMTNTSMHAIIHTPAKGCSSCGN